MCYRARWKNGERLCRWKVTDHVPGDPLEPTPFGAVWDSELASAKTTLMERAMSAYENQTESLHAKSNVRVRLGVIMGIVVAVSCSGFGYLYNADTETLRAVDKVAAECKEARLEARAAMQEQFSRIFTAMDKRINKVEVNQQSDHDMLIAATRDLEHIKQGVDSIVEGIDKLRERP